jgi:hypothetical protein
MVEPFRQAMDDRILEPVVIEDGRIEEGGKQRIARDRLLGFLADGGPDGIDRLDRSGPHAPLALFISASLVVGACPARTLSLLRNAAE